MKKFTLLILLTSVCTMGQYFEQEQAEEAETNQNQFFDNSQSAQAPNPEYGTDEVGNPDDPIPLDDWAFLLPLAGMAIGVYFIRRRKIVND